MDPLELVRETRRRHPEARIILSSQFGDFALAGRALECGVDAFLRKPFTRAEVAHTFSWLAGELPRRSLADPVVARIDDFLESCATGTVRQSELLGAIGVSRSALFRRLKRSTGHSLESYISARRLEWARHLIEHSDRSVGEVAAAVGIDDPNYFSRWFKRNTTVSPTDHRRAIRRQHETIDVGVPVPLSGAYSDMGSHVLEGARFAAEETQHRLGTPVRVYPLDTATDPAIAAQRIWQAVRDRGVRLFAGVVSSAVLSAVTPVIEAAEAVLVTSAGVGAAENAHGVFRWALPPSQAVRSSLGPLLEREGGIRRCCTITADYVFGHALLSSVQPVLDEHGVELVGGALHPVGLKDFASILEQVRRAKAQLLVLLNYGRDTFCLLRQARSLGITKDMQTLAVWSSGLYDLRALGDRNAEGVYFGTQYWHDSMTPGNGLFCRRWERVHGARPTYLEAQGYVGASMILMAAERNQSADCFGVRRALEHLEWDGLTAPREFMHPETHQTEKGYFLLQALAADTRGPQNSEAVGCSARVLGT